MPINLYTKVMEIFYCLDLAAVLKKKLDMMAVAFEEMHIFIFEGTIAHHFFWTYSC